MPKLKPSFCSASEINAPCAPYPESPDDALHEACGVFGIWAPDADVARLTFFGLQALQHRGQESAGIAVSDGATLTCEKGLGLAREVFDDATIAALQGQAAVGHVRYSTSGGKASWEAAQPHISAIDDTLIARAHNGTLVNTNHLRAQLIDEGEHLRAGTDSEVAAKAIGHLTRQFSGSQIDISHLPLHAVILHRDSICIESVGSKNIGTGIQILTVD